MDWNLSHRVKERGVDTKLVRLSDDEIALRFHDTYVVRAYKSGPVKINSNGWRTSTTKERINRYLPDGYHLYQTHWDWYVTEPYGGITQYKDNMFIGEYNGTIH